MGRARRCTCVRSLHRRGNASRFAYRNRLHFDLVQRCLALRCQPTPFTQLCPCAVVWESTSLSTGTLSVTVRGLCTEATLVRLAADAMDSYRGRAQVAHARAPCARGNVPEHIGDRAVRRADDACPTPSETVALPLEHSCLRTHVCNPNPFARAFCTLACNSTRPFSSSAFTSFPCSRSAHQPMARTRTRAVKTLPWRPRASWLLSPVDAESAWLMAV